MALTQYYKKIYKIQHTMKLKILITWIEVKLANTLTSSQNFYQLIKFSQILDNL